jgi:adenine-specific DNA methylase
LVGAASAGLFPRHRLRPLIGDPGEDHPEKHEELLELNKHITPWEAVKGGNLEDIERARELILKQRVRSPRVLDPFAGGGSIPLEALSLGCETCASDYNPVVAFIEKATPEWPQKLSIEVELPCQMGGSNDEGPHQLTFEESHDRPFQASSASPPGSRVS